MPGPTIGTPSDLKVYDEFYQSGLYEGIAQKTAGFNEASGGCIRLVTKRHIGDFTKEAFFQDVENLIHYRDPSDLSAATDIPLTQGELATVKVPRGVGPVAQTFESWQRIGKTNEELSFQLGKMVAAHKAKDYINTAIMVIVAGLNKIGSSVTYDATGMGAGTITHTHLVSAMAKLGDFSQEIRCFVMHSKQYFDLMKQSIADKIFEVAGVTIYQGTIATFGKPVVVLDSPSLFASGGSTASVSDDTYNVLMLKDMSCVVEESQTDFLVGQVITGLGNLAWRIQGEYAFNIGLKGMAWVLASGANPEDTDLATSNNWSLKMSSYKNGPGVLLKVK
jgi:hypothetical protein